MLMEVNVDLLQCKAQLLNSLAAYLAFLSDQVVYVNLKEVHLLCLMMLLGVMDLLPTLHISVIIVIVL